MANRIDVFVPLPERLHCENGSSLRNHSAGSLGPRGESAPEVVEVGAAGSAVRRNWVSFQPADIAAAAHPLCKLGKLNDVVYRSLRGILLALACCALAAAQDLATVSGLLEAGRVEEAWSALQKSPGAESVEGHLLASRILEERGDLPGAAAQAEAALAADPLHQPARLQLGRLFLTGNNPEAALDVFVEGLQPAPDSTLLRLGEALALNQLRRYEQALDRFTSVLGSSPGFALALDGFLEAALELQRFEEARQVVSNGLKAAPSDHRGYYRLALIGDRSGSSSAEETERLLRRSIEGEPRFAPAYSLLGKALLQLERPEEAALMLETALRLNPGDRLGRIQLARAYRVLGRPEDAKREAETVRKLQDAKRADSGVLRRRDGDSPTASPPR